MTKSILNNKNDSGCHTRHLVEHLNKYTDAQRSYILNNLKYLYDFSTGSIIEDDIEEFL